MDVELTIEADARQLLFEKMLSVAVANAFVKECIYECISSRIKDLVQNSVNEQMKMFFQSGEVSMINVDVMLDDVDGKYSSTKCVTTVDSIWHDGKKFELFLSIDLH